MANYFGLSLATRTIVLVVTFHTAAGQYAPSATIERLDSQLIIKSDDPRPLEQALIAITQRFGWSVDYEDPIYSGIESKDISVPQWRKTHPNEVGFLAPSGSSFVASLAADNIGSREEAALNSLVAQYNNTSNPGVFRVSDTSGGRLAVIGFSRTRQTNDPLEVMVQPDPQSEAASVVLQKLIARCSSASGVRMTVGTFPQNIFAQSIIKGHEKASSCRSQLADILGSTPGRCVYRILYDIGSATYVWNVVPAATHM